jgi:hypothetical protein
MADAAGGLNTSTSVIRHHDLESIGSLSLSGYYDAVQFLKEWKIERFNLDLGNEKHHCSIFRA